MFGLKSLVVFWQIPGLKVVCFLRENTTISTFDCFLLLIEIMSEIVLGVVNENRNQLLVLLFWSLRLTTVLYENALRVLKQAIHIFNGLLIKRSLTELKLTECQFLKLGQSFLFLIVFYI